MLGVDDRAELYSAKRKVREGNNKGAALKRIRIAAAKLKLLLKVAEALKVIARYFDV